MFISVYINPFLPLLILFCLLPLSLVMATKAPFSIVWSRISWYKVCVSVLFSVDCSGFFNYKMGREENKGEDSLQPPHPSLLHPFIAQQTLPPLPAEECVFVLKLFWIWSSSWKRLHCKHEPPAMRFVAGVELFWFICALLSRVRLRLQRRIICLSSGFKLANSQFASDPLWIYHWFCNGTDKKYNSSEKKDRTEVIQKVIEFKNQPQFRVGCKV